MIRNYFEPMKLGIIEALFEHIEKGATIREIQSELPRNAKFPDRHLQGLIEMGIVVCENEAAAPNERIYHGNLKSKVFTTLCNFEIDLGTKETERKKKLLTGMRK